MSEMPEMSSLPAVCRGLAVESCRQALEIQCGGGEEEAMFSAHITLV